MTRVVVLAPHADDETLGVGGTIVRHVNNGDEVSVIVATGHGPEAHPFIDPDAFAVVRAEARKAMDVLGVHRLTFGDLPAVTFPEGPTWQTNKWVHAALEEHRPEVLYVPFPYDLHGDHRALFHAASVAWRPTTELGRGIRRVLAYEVQSETHWSAPYLEQGFTPNVWVGLTDAQLNQKLLALSQYASQMYDFPQARSIAAVEHLARWRGSQQGCAAAEGFVLVKETLA